MKHYDVGGNNASAPITGPPTSTGEDRLDNDLETLVHNCLDHGPQVRETKGVMVHPAWLSCTTCGADLGIIRERQAEPAYKASLRRIEEGERRDRERRGLS